jgi:hypothetical protein
MSGDKNADYGSFLRSAATQTASALEQTDPATATATAPEIPRVGLGALTNCQKIDGQRK